MKTLARFYKLLGRLSLFIGLCLILACQEEVKAPEQCYLSELTYTTNYAEKTVSYNYDSQYNLVKIDGWDIDYDPQGRQLNSFIFSSPLVDVYGNGKPCRSREMSFTYVGDKKVVALITPTWDRGRCPAFDGPDYTDTLYFKEGKLIRELRQYSMWRDSTVYTYQDGNLNQYRNYHKSNNEPCKLEELVTYEYDNKLNPFAIKGLIKIQGEAVFSYSKNNVTRIERFSIFDQYVQVTECTYTYNEKGYPLTRDTGEQKVKFQYLCKQ
jgi:hypothetical protein